MTGHDRSLTYDVNRENGPVYFKYSPFSTGEVIESTIYDLESLVPLGKAIKFANLIGLCLEHNGKGFKPGQIKRLLQLIDRSEALRSFKPLVNEIRDFTSKELEQLLFFSECICEAQ